MQQGDVPFFKSLADQYTVGDNYHQPVIGGTGPNSVLLGFADQVFFGDGAGNAATPPAGSVYNPDPEPGTLNLYTARKQWFNCSDATQPGIKPILDYLGKLPYPVQTKCDADHYYNAVNIKPAWTPQGGTPSGVGAIPPVTMTSIGDLLSAKNIPWKYYGGGYNASGTGTPLDGLYCNICNPFEYQLTYPAMPRRPHARRHRSVRRSEERHLTSRVLCQAGRHHGRPSGILEIRSVRSICQEHHRARPGQQGAVGEHGDFRHGGRGRRLLRLRVHPAGRFLRHRSAHSDDAVSRFSEGGHITHVYAEHSSFVKFVERNWYLGKLSDRSRDNLPDPRLDSDTPYIPANMPAIGDLFDMFNFDRDGGRVK